MAEHDGRRTFETPEGVAVTVELGACGTRAGALLIDLVIIVCTTVVAALCVSVLAPIFGSATSSALFLLVSLFLRAPYFLFFELRWQGQTPGKRLLGLRVVDRRGGPLSATGLAARNLMREVEVFMPATLLAATHFNVPGQSSATVYAALIWLGLFTFMPVFNRNKLRLGDMFGGTWVIAVERAFLQHDLASRARTGAISFRFSACQLDAYGIAELQVLEQVLRSPATTGSRATQKAVCARICSRINWPSPQPATTVEVERFLSDYYAALRAHLERHALFGDRRKDKHTLEARRGSSDAAAATSARARQDNEPSTGKPATQADLDAWER